MSKITYIDHGGEGSASSDDAHMGMPLVESLQVDLLGMFVPCDELHLDRVALFERMKMGADAVHIIPFDHELYDAVGTSDHCVRPLDEL